jgi:GGDEF domain-containing protein
MSRAEAISERTGRQLLQLFPTAQGRPDAERFLVDQLVEAELHRRGTPDQTGAFHALALTQGSLLKEEFDLGSQAHTDGWVLGALLVDPLEFMVFNMKHGFAEGDAALRAMVEGMKAQFPTAKVVRTHTDGFAVLMGPTAELRASTEQLPGLRAELSRRVPGVEFTVGAVELTVVEPPNWQVLGPLAWAELERAHLIVRRSRVDEVLRRRVEMHGRLPDFSNEA